MMKEGRKDKNSEKRTHIESVAGQICENDQYVCMGGDVFGPFHLYLTLKQNWNMLEHAQTAMQEHYIDGKKPGAQPVVNEKHLVPGDFVAYNFKDEWHRGKIMGITKGGSECEVKLIDYGAAYLEKTRMLKVLHHSNYTLMAQAIGCQLDLSPKVTSLLKQLDIPRKKLVEKALIEIMRDRDLMVIFKELSVEGQGSNKEIKWKVDMYIADRTEKNDMIVHLGEGRTVQAQLLRKLRAENVIPSV